MRKVFLENLPRKEGIGALKGKQVIDWIGSVGYKVKFIYDDIEGEFEILNIDSNKRRIYIMDLNKNCFDMQIGNFQICKIATIVGKISSDFKVKLFDTIKDNKRDLTIIDMERRVINKKGKTVKYIKYKCNTCSYENWIVEDGLLKGTGCPCCCDSPQVSVLGINTIWDTDKWMIDLGIFEEDAKKYTRGSKKNVRVRCPNCTKERTLPIYQILSQKSIGCYCGDNFSYPEKFFTMFLEQLKVTYIGQLGKKYLSWCNGYRYDFYLPEHNTIIEVHGMQHYIEKKKWRTLEEEQENDRLKEELALKNGITNYIVLDCRKSELEWIKNSILNSQLAEIIDLSNIDWLKCEEFALNNRVKEVCDIKKQNPNMSTSKIAKTTNLSLSTTLSYLKKGSNLGWCIFNLEDEEKRRIITASTNAAKSCSKPIEVFKDGKSLGIFKSGHELSRQSELLLGMFIHQGTISTICRGKQNNHKGITFEFTTSK